jgi:hypothetical protein
MLVAGYWRLDTPALHIRNPASALAEKDRISAYSSLFQDNFFLPGKKAPRRRTMPLNFEMFFMIQIVFGGNARCNHPQNQCSSAFESA